MLGSIVMAIALFVPFCVLADGGVPAKPDSQKPLAPVVEKKEARRCILAYAFLPVKWMLCSTSKALAYLHTTHPKKFYTALALMCVGGGAAAYCALNHCDLSAYLGSEDDADKNDDKQPVTPEQDVRYVSVGR